MSTIKKSLHELVVQTKDYVANTYDRKDWVSADPEGYAFFKALAQRRTTPRAEPAPAKPTQMISKPLIAVVSKPQVSAPVARPLPPAAPPAPQRPMAPIQPIVADEKKKKVEVEKPGFALVPMPPVESIDLGDLRKAVSKLAPQLKIIDTVPVPKAPNAPTIRPNAIAVLFAGRTSSEGQRFLRSVAQAIEVTFGICEITDSKQAIQGLCTIDIIDPMIYLQEPLRKAQLWIEISAKLRAP